MNNKYKNLEINVRKKLNWDFLGSFNSAFKWLWIEFDSLREYVPWDNIKSIDWKTTAKMWEVFVKNYEEQKDLKVLFIINKTESLNFWSETKTKKEILEEVFFVLAKLSLLNWFSIWSFVNNEFVDFKKDESNIIKTLKCLEKYSVSLPLREIEWGLIKKNNLRDNLIFFIWDSIEPDLNMLKYLNIKNEIIYINIFDYFENNLSEDNFEFNLFWNKILNLFLWKSIKIEEFKTLRKSKLENLKRILKKQRIEYISFDNRDDIFLKFYKFFSKYKN